MSKLVTFFLIFIVMAECTVAQQKTKSAVTFHSLQQLGMINGNGAVSGLIQTVNGVECSQWFAGVGVGLDFYRYRSVPLFVNVKRYFSLKNNNALFIYADGGYNQPWLKDNKETYSWGSGSTETKSQYKGGLYTDAGFGYAIKFKSGNKMLLNIGYSYKYFEENKITKTVTGGVAGNTENTNSQKYKYNFNRLMIKIGWEF